MTATAKWGTGMQEQDIQHRFNDRKDIFFPIEVEDGNKTY